jgi:hypothetical protein
MTTPVARDQAQAATPTAQAVAPSHRIADHGPMWLPIAMAS